ncbi:MAG TPA: ATP-binding cassette domain-containing protein, partial [Amycolatopsis sp.]|nr:ATP-binding cassette domain-containing protein [Amycolatopsis sp.]
LSGGQRQRVAMGRAIVRNPKAFLMDEPLSNLDAKLRGQMRTSVSKIQKQLGTTTLYVTHDQVEAMTLGDRVVVLRAGYVQQIGSPQFLYDNPANLFVAGFIGSPSMNFVPATLEEGSLRSALGTTPLTDRIRRLVEAADAPRELIAGIRPEHFEDAALVEASKRGGGSTFTAHIDVLESMGSEKFAHFTVEGELATAAELAELAEDSGSVDVPGSASQIVARLSASSSAAENADLEVWYDTDKIKLFDPSTGKNLTYTE